MTTQAHTPGPLDWMTVSANAVGGFYAYIIDERKRKIAALWGKAGEKQGNAVLFAAAPDMLALLQELIDIEGPQPGTSEWAGKVQAVIAKATARSAA